MARKFRAKIVSGDQGTNPAVTASGIKISKTLK